MRLSAVSLVMLAALATVVAGCGEPASPPATDDGSDPAVAAAQEPRADDGAAPGKTPEETESPPSLRETSPGAEFPDPFREPDGTKPATGAPGPTGKSPDGAGPESKPKTPQLRDLLLESALADGVIDEQTAGVVRARLGWAKLLSRVSSGRRRVPKADIGSTVHAPTAALPEDIPPLRIRVSADVEGRIRSLRLGARSVHLATGELSKSVTEIIGDDRGPGSVAECLGIELDVDRTLRFAELIRVLDELGARGPVVRARRGSVPNEAGRYRIGPCAGSVSAARTNRTSWPSEFPSA